MRSFVKTAVSSGALLGKRKAFSIVSNQIDGSHVGGCPWADVPEFARPHVAWIDGRGAPFQDTLPTTSEMPIPEILFTLTSLHPDRPRGSKPMLDASGAKARLENCRPGAWLISPFSDWKWAKWPDGEVGWVPANIQLPGSLRVKMTAR